MENGQKYETINKAIDKLSKLTHEDFHGYRCEIWNVLSDVYNSNCWCNPKIVKPKATVGQIVMPNEVEEELKYIARRLAKLSGMPYAWEDVLYRLYHGYQLPFKFLKERRKNE